MLVKNDFLVFIFATETKQKKCVFKNAKRRKWKNKKSEQGKKRKPLEHKGKIGEAIFGIE